MNERSGSDGFGLVVQDINGTHDRCLSAVYDVESYPRMVPCVKSVDTYEKFTAMNVTKINIAKLNISLCSYYWYLGCGAQKVSIHSRCFGLQIWLLSQVN